jgi:alkylation response protein AidB-like acyl-CoA dehydrogenase
MTSWSPVSIAFGAMVAKMNIHWIVGTSMSHELRYHPCADQRALAETFNTSLKALLPLSRLHESPEESDQTWSELEAIGLFSITLSQEAGGSGLGAAEEALIVMELGRCLASPSVLATIGATHAKSIAGTQRTAAAYRQGDRIVLVDDNRAVRMLLRDDAGTAVHRVPATRNVIDDQLWHARLAEIDPLHASEGDFDVKGVLRLRLNDAAALSGIAEAALEMAVSYASERKQFGRPIGGFQAIKHHCANMTIAARSARDQTSFASIALDDGRHDAPLHVDCALLVASMAALQNTAMNIQIHGGIGFSDEAYPHLLLKRARLLIAIAGGMEAANARIADAGALPER